MVLFVYCAAERDGGKYKDFPTVITLTFNCTVVALEDSPNLSMAEWAFYGQRYFGHEMFP